MHKTRETAALCTAKAERRREKLNKVPKFLPFTKAKAREALDVVNCYADVLVLEKRWRCMRASIIDAIVKGRFYIARSIANDGVVRRETPLTDCGFTDEAMAALNARELVNVGNLKFRLDTGALFVVDELSKAQVRHVLATLGHWPLVKPGFLV